MIAVQMTDEDVIYPMKVSLHAHELHLSSFATINQERSTLNLDKLSSWMSSISGHSSARPKNGNFETQNDSIKSVQQKTKACLALVLRYL
jgi:hypothetical protein